MPSTFALLEGEYLRDLLEQPEALRKTLGALYKSAPLADLIEIRERSFRRIVLTGMGSSLHALWPAYLRLNHCGLTAWMIETSELIHSLREVLAPDTLLIAVSQSGRSAEIIRLLELPGRGAIVSPDRFDSGEKLHPRRWSEKNVHVQPSDKRASASTSTCSRDCPTPAAISFSPRASKSRSSRSAWDR